MCEKTVCEKTARLVAYQHWLLNVAHVYKLTPPVPWSYYHRNEFGRFVQVTSTTSHIVVSCGVDGMTGRVEIMAWASDAKGDFIVPGDPDERGEPLCQLVDVSDHNCAPDSLGYRVIDSDIPPPVPHLELLTLSDIQEFNRLQEEHVASLKASIAELDRIIANLPERVI